MLLETFIDNPTDHCPVMVLHGQCNFLPECPPSKIHPDDIIHELRATGSNESLHHLPKYYTSDLLGIKENEEPPYWAFFKEVATMSAEEKKTTINFGHRITTLLKEDDICDKKGIKYLAKFLWHFSPHSSSYTLLDNQLQTAIQSILAVPKKVVLKATLWGHCMALNTTHPIFDDRMIPSCPPTHWNPIDHKRDQQYYISTLFHVGEEDIPPYKAFYGPDVHAKDQKEDEENFIRLIVALSKYDEVCDMVGVKYVGLFFHHFCKSYMHDENMGAWKKRFISHLLNSTDAIFIVAKDWAGC